MSATIAMTIPGAYSVVRWESSYGDDALHLVNVFLAAAQGLGFAEASMLDAMWAVIEERDPEKIEKMLDHPEV